MVSGKPGEVPLRKMEIQIEVKLKDGYWFDRACGTSRCGKWYFVYEFTIGGVF